jgi:hypothetical protein
MRLGIAVADSAMGLVLLLSQGWADVTPLHQIDSSWHDGMQVRMGWPIDLPVR